MPTLPKSLRVFVSDFGLEGDEGRETDLAARPETAVWNPQQPAPRNPVLLKPVHHLGLSLCCVTYSSTQKQFTALKSVVPQHTIQGTRLMAARSHGCPSYILRGPHPSTNRAHHLPIVMTGVNSALGSAVPVASHLLGQPSFDPTSRSAAIGCFLAASSNLPPWTVRCRVSTCRTCKLRDT